MSLSPAMRRSKRAARFSTAAPAQRTDISNSTFSGNTQGPTVAADDGGAAIFTNGGTTTITGSTFSTATLRPAMAVQSTPTTRVFEVHHPERHQLDLLGQQRDILGRCDIHLRLAAVARSELYSVRQFGQWRQLRRRSKQRFDRRVSRSKAQLLQREHRQQLRRDNHRRGRLRNIAER